MDDEKQAIEEVLRVVLNGGSVTLTENLLVENVEDARRLLHEASLMLAQLGELLGSAALTMTGDVLHRVSCEKTATGEQTTQPETEEPKSWNSELPFH